MITRSRREMVNTSQQQQKTTKDKQTIAKRDRLLIATTWISSSPQNAVKVNTQRKNVCVRIIVHILFLS